jgi:hypothetical protein
MNIMTYAVYTTKEFDDSFSSLDESEKARVRKILNQLK